MFQDVSLGVVDELYRGSTVWGNRQRDFSCLLHYRGQSIFANRLS